MKNCLMLTFLLFPLFMHADWAQQTLDSMSLKHKVGQLVVPSLHAHTQIALQEMNALITEYQIGGVLLLVHFDRQTPCEQARLIDSLQQVSTIPLLIAQDLEWGLAMRLRDVIKFPYNMTLAALSDKHLIYELGKEIGRQCKLMGVHINFAPVVDINSNPKNPVIAYRAFGAHKHTVTECALQYMAGMHDAGVVTCAKHFPGHGDTSIDSHISVPCLPHAKEVLDERELYPFYKMIEASVPMIMVGHLQVPALDPSMVPASLSKTIITDVLKNQLQFNGIVVTDGLNMGGIISQFSSGEAAVRALVAGNDLLIDCENPREALEALINAVYDGVVSEQQLNQSVLKILRLKESLGLTEYQQPTMPISEQFHTPYAYQLKGQLFKEAVTVVRDTENLIPCIISDNVAALFIEDELTSLHKYVNNSPYHAFSLPTQASDIQMEKLLTDLVPFETVVVSIFGMNNHVHKQCGISTHTLLLIEHLKKSGKKVIVILFGTPYAIQFFENVGTLIVAYEADIDAQFAAGKVVLGKIQATGILPI